MTRAAAATFQGRSGSSLAASHSFDLGCSAYMHWQLEVAFPLSRTHRMGFDSGASVHFEGSRTPTTMNEPGSQANDPHGPG